VDFFSQQIEAQLSNLHIPIILLAPLSLTASLKQILGGADSFGPARALKTTRARLRALRNDNALRHGRR
jgi:hypothetical protein